MTDVSGVRYLWHEVPVPSGLVITQVYGYLLCPRTGRVLVQDDEGAFSLPGGTPEPGNADLAATLAREAFQHNQVRVGATAYLGYQEVRRPGRVPYAQVRMTGVIEEFAPRAPDPGGGRVYRRLMTSLGTAPSVLGWGLPGVLQARAAARVARLEWELPVNTRPRRVTRTDSGRHPVLSRRPHSLICHFLQLSTARRSDRRLHDACQERPGRFRGRCPEPGPLPAKV
jgi:hypothetical protein